MTDINAKNNKKDSMVEQDGYLFSVEVLIKGKTNGRALETLTHLLNNEQVTDYRVLNGINLGQIISDNLDKPKEKIVQAKEAVEDNKHAVKKDKEIKHDAKSVEPKNSKQHLPITEQIKRYKEDKSLVRITVNKGKGVKLSIPCRILNFDWSAGNITAYHVDEKKVYSIDLNEIDDLVSG